MSARAWRALFFARGLGARGLRLGAWGLCIGSVACERVDVYAVIAPESSAPSSSTGGAAVNTDGSPSAVQPPTSGETMSEVESASFDAGVSSVPGVESASPDAGVPSAPPQSAGCLEPALAVGDTDITLRVGDSTRSYVLHVPEAYDGSTAVPLIVDFHGIGESGSSELEASPYPALTDPEGVIMAFPDGAEGPLGSAWNFGPCCVAEVDDLGFARALVNDVSASACIDPTRIYAVGVLTGGGMVQHLACEAADLFAAVAPAAFDLLAETAPQCAPTRPITVISFRGTEDDRVPYEGGPSAVVPGMPITFLGAQNSAQRWAEINACAGSLSAEDARGCASYSECAAGVEVTLCTEHGGGEAPGDARVAWPVLSRHSL